MTNTEAVVYIVLGVVAALLVAFIVYKSGRVRVRRDPGGGIEFEASGEDKKTAATGVLEDAEITDSKIGKVIGVDGNGGSGSGDVQVGKRMKVSRAEIDSITGRSASGTPKDDPSES